MKKNDLDILGIPKDISTGTPMPKVKSPKPKELYTEITITLNIIPKEDV